MVPPPAASDAAQRPHRRQVRDGNAAAGSPAPRPPSGASFALGASGRLLPLTVPLRFFGAAAVFHGFAWIALGLGAAQVPRFAGGIGWPLASLHATTLGVLAMSAIGASLQLMPVATRQSVGAPRVVGALWWLYAPGVAALVAGMAAQRPSWVAIAALPVIAALVLYGVLVARNLAGARGMPGVRAMGWIALLSLTMAVACAAAITATWAGWAAWPRQGLLMAHLVYALFGFMGALALGLSNILVPMFVLGPVPAERAQLGIAALVAAALALVLPVAFDLWPPAMLLLSVAVALAAAWWHLASMRRVMRAGMRRALGGSFVLVRIGWGGLIATLTLGAWWALDGARAGLSTAVVACALALWLLSFLFGILQRIVPFLVSMHLAGTRRRAPTPSSLTDERALTLHRRCHAAALALLALAIALDSAAAAIAASAVGCVGALGFVGFLLTAWRRMRRPREAHAAGAAAGVR
jgi:hypothetical protein